ENGIDLAEYVAQLRYSYWEYIHGYNLYIAADPVIANRYRVFARWFEMVQRGIGGEFRPLMRLSYDIFDGVNKISDDRTPPAILDRMQDILHLYNEVRSLFGQQMCWIEEIQLGANGALYFLQRSVGQLFKPCAWSFDGDEACDLLIGHTYDYGEVRGTTPKEGIKVDFVLDEGIRARRLKSYSHTALLDAHIDSSVCEQQRLLSIPAYIQTSPPHHGSGICDPHSAILPIVRCPLFLSAPKMHKKFPADILDRIRTVSRAKRGDDPQWYMNHKKMARIKLHIRSDGNEARVRVVNIY
ncbi:MAG TPA: hypothetical protein VN495_01925, partial [Candidatus Paceibacterota bacterium]|nr:hypothetical protein [Candidatus Paceibacterota bacterium]